MKKSHFIPLLSPLAPQNSRKSTIPQGWLPQNAATCYNSTIKYVSEIFPNPTILTKENPPYEVVSVRRISLPVGIISSDSYTEPGLSPHIGARSERAGVIPRNSKEVLGRSGELSRLQVPPLPCSDRCICLQGSSSISLIPRQFTSQVLIIRKTSPME